MGHLRNLRGTLLCVFVFVRVRVLVHYVHTYTDINESNGGTGISDRADTRLDPPSPARGGGAQALPPAPLYLLAPSVRIPASILLPLFTARLSPFHFNYLCIYENFC